MRGTLFLQPTIPLWIKVRTHTQMFASVQNTPVWHETHSCVHMALSLGGNHDLQVVDTISLYVPQELIQCRWQNLHRHFHLRCQQHRATIPAHEEVTSSPTIHQQAPLRSSHGANPYFANLALTSVTAEIAATSLAATFRAIPMVGTIRRERRRTFWGPHEHG